MRSTRSRSWTEGAIGRLLGFGRVPAPAAIFALDVEHSGDLRLRCARLAGAGARGGLRGSGPGGTLAFEFLDQVSLPATVLAPGPLGPLGSALRDSEHFAESVRRLLDGPGAKAGAAHAVRDVTLLLPESWLRVVMMESGELPKGAAARDEVLRFRLRRLVPYRMEDLRVAAVEAAILPGQEEAYRLAVGFTSEAVLASFERAFAAAGVRVGFVTVPSLALFAGLRAGQRHPGIEIGVLAQSAEYSLWIRRDDELVMHRQRSFPDALPDEARETLARRELSMIGAMFETELIGETLGRVVIHLAAGANEAWPDWLEQTLGRPAQILGREHFPLALAQAPPWENVREALPLVGAACLEVQ